MAARSYLFFDLGSGANARGSAGVWAIGRNMSVNGRFAKHRRHQRRAILLTGVKLEIGGVATPFNRQSLAKSMADCQRYYQASQVLSIQTPTVPVSELLPQRCLYVLMRASPTLTINANGSVNQAFPAGAPTAAGSVDQFAANKTASATNISGNYTQSIVVNASAEL